MTTNLEANLERAQDKTFGDVPEGKHAMAVMDGSGDTKAFWDAGKPEEVEAARRQFDFLVKEKKYSAFHVRGKDGAQGEQMRAFDPAAERIIFVPQMQGG